MSNSLAQLIGVAWRGMVEVARGGGCAPRAGGPVRGEDTPVGDERASESSVGLGCREHPAVGRRRPRGSLRYTDDEWAVIVQAATVARMRPGAWVQQVAFETAVRRRGGGLPERAVVDELLAELRQQRRVLTNIGGNLNDLARAANITGLIENPLAVATVLRLVRNVVIGADELIGRVRADLLP